MRFRSSIKLTLALVLAGCLAMAAYAANQPVVNGSGVRLLQSVTWTLATPKRWFGGFSGLSMAADGLSFKAISDRGFVVHVDLKRENNRIEAATLTEMINLRDRRGRRLHKGNGDAEGLALASDGSMFISFERSARVYHYPLNSQTPTPLPKHLGFSGLPTNKELEALAIDAAGRLYTLPEKSRGNVIPVWRWDGGEWEQPFTVAKRDGFQPVGADIGPDGRFYLLERKFLIVGFVSRLRRWDITDTALTEETILFSTSLGTHDNLEGLTIWRAPDNSLRATMISDDNFRNLQRTEIVEYQLGS